MSKRNKSTQPVNEQPDPTPSEDIFEAEGSIMATEAKVGLAIIGVLLISFGVVLFARFNKPADNAVVASTDNKSNEQEVRKTFASPEETNFDVSNEPSTITAQPTYDTPDTRVVSAEVGGGWSMAGDQPGDSMTEELADVATSVVPTSRTQQVLIPPEESYQAYPAIESNRVPTHAVSSGVGEQTVPDPPGMASYPSMQVPINEPGTTTLPNPLREPAVIETPEVRPTSNQVATPLRIPSSNPEPTPPARPLPATPVGQFGYSPISGSVPESSSGAGALKSLPDNGVYTIQANDNYWVISKKLYGTGAYFQALAEYNRKNHPDPSQLRLGQKILSPSSEELEKDYPDFCPRPDHRKAAARHVSVVSTQGLSAGRTYIVQEGDSLYDIAKHELGKVSRVAELIELNRNILGTDYEYLTPGMKLVLPAKEPTARVTRTPGSTSPR